MHTATRPSSVAGPLSTTRPSPAGGPPSADPSFAGLLATMAAPQGKASILGETPWNDDGLADDVASITYEHALRAHARMRPEVPEAGPTMRDNSPNAAGPAKPLKSASITIRLSEPECAQLRQRATEAGMTISAYLRSCTLEVESLRAQVKQTLAEIRRTAPKPVEPDMQEESAGVIQ